MELERMASGEGRQSLYVCFTRSEWKSVAAMAKRKINDYNRRIRAIENNPNNEGQAKYSEAIRELRAEIEFCNQLIELSK